MFSTGSCREVTSTKSFLFSLYNIYGYFPAKMTTKPTGYGYSTAIYTCHNEGPTFGGGRQLRIADNALIKIRHSYTICGGSYNYPPRYQTPRGHSCRFFTEFNGFTPTDVEVFYETTTWGVCAKSYLLTQPTFMDPVSFARLAKWKWSTWSLYLKF